MNELELILTDVFKCSRLDLYANSLTFTFNEYKLNRLDKIFKNRARNFPLQYALGYTEFMGLRFKVDDRVLIPRQDTEILVETVMDENLKLKTQNSKLNILDIGTGSGCIAISLAKFLEGLEIFALDISRKALNLARGNAEALGVKDKITFINSDLFNHKMFKSGIKFDMIVSNPPYIASDEIGALDNTLLAEPKIALDGGKDGFDFYRLLRGEAHKYLKEGGRLILEFGYGQAQGIRNIFAPDWEVLEIKKDYSDVERVCVIGFNDRVKNSLRSWRRDELTQLRKSKVE